jgi:hypothetical protein
MEESMNLSRLPSLGGLLDEFLKNAREARARQEKEKERLLVEWQNTKNMPRKMKKRRRKEILVSLTILDWGASDEISDEELEECIALFKNLISC